MHPANSAEGPLTPGLVFEMLQAHQKTAALQAAIELDVFRAVGEGPGDVASIARHCLASERGIRILCDFLTICGVLVKEGGRYRHTPASAAFLDPRSPSSLASVAQFLGNQAMRDPYDHLAEIVRTGRTILPGDGSVEPENPIWVLFAETMAPMMAPMAVSYTHLSKPHFEFGWPWASCGFRLLPTAGPSPSNAIRGMAPLDEEYSIRHPPVFCSQRQSKSISLDKMSH